MSAPSAALAAQPAQDSGRLSSLPERLGRGVVVNYVTVAMIAIATLVTTPILLHHLGVAQYGVFVVAGSTVAYLELLELGFGTATTKLVAEDAERGPEAVVRTLNTNIAVLSVMGLVAIVIGLGIARFVPEWLNIPPSLDGRARLAFAIMAVALSISIPFDAFGGGLVAFGRLDLLSESNLVRAVGAAVGGAAAAAAGADVVVVTTVGACCGVATHYLRWRMLKRLVPNLRLSPRLVERWRLRRTSALSGWFLLRDATEVVINRLDVVVVGAVLGIRAAAVYSIGLKLAQLGIRALQPFSQLFFPRAAGLHAQGDTAGLASLLVDGTRVSLAVCMPVMLGLALLADPAIKAWVGPHYPDAVGVLIVLSIANGLSAITETAWWMLGGAGHIRATSLVSMVEAILNLALSVVLAKQLGPIGVAYGTLIGIVATRLPVAFLLAARSTELRLLDILRGGLVPHLAPVVVTGAVILATRDLVPVESAAILGYGLGIAFLYTGTYLLFGASHAERDRIHELWGRLRHSVPAHSGTWMPEWRAHTSVAVVACTYQRPEGLARLLDALPAGLAQTATAAAGRIEARVLVVDNEASEATAAIVAERAARMRWPVEYVAQPVRGISQARNVGVHQALQHADFIAFIDDDEEPEPGWLEALVRTQQQTGADIVMGPKDVAFDVPPPRWVERGGFFRPSYHQEGTPLTFATTANVLIRSSVFGVAQPPFDERLGLAGGEDTKFFRQAHLAGHRIVWSRGGRVLEHVGPARATARWLVQREYRRGTTLGYCLIELENSLPRRLKRRAHAMQSIGRGVAAAVVGVVTGRAARVRGAQRIAFGLGILRGMSGRLYDEYDDPARYEMRPSKVLP
jgi:O-antigen/teichoic acid export membrane protein/glycosyltransferase involved in cell wall biosynthesis